MVFKIIYKEGGAHTHFRVWAGKKEGALGLAGQLSMTNIEFEAFRQILARGAIGAKVVFEEQTISSPATRENNDFRPA